MDPPEQLQTPAPSPQKAPPPWRCLTCKSFSATSAIIFLLAVIIASVTIATVFEDSLSVRRLPLLQKATTELHATSIGTVMALPLSARLEMWKRAFSDFDQLRTSPMGDILPHALAGLYDWQNPADCTRAHFLIFDYRTGLGFGAQVKHFLMAFHHALRTRRILLIKGDTKQFWTDGCPWSLHNPGFECFFKPLSDTCPYKRVNELVRNGQLSDVKFVPSDDANKAPGIPIATDDADGMGTVVRLALSDFKGSQFRSFLHSFSSSNDSVRQIQLLAKNATAGAVARYTQPVERARRVWQTMAAYFFLRLKNATARYVEHELWTILQPHDAAATGAGLTYDRIVGVPIRKSDKCYGNSVYGPGEMTCPNLTDVMETALRFAFGDPRITHVVLTSEEAGAISDDKVEAAQKEVKFHDRLTPIWNSRDLTPETGAVSHSPKKGTSRAALLRSSLVSLHLQSLAGVHVLTPRSTFHSLIAVFGDTVPGKPVHRMFPLGSGEDLTNSIKSQII